GGARGSSVMDVCEAIWVAADDVDKALVEPLTHLLVAAIVGDKPDRPAAIYTVNGNAPFVYWDTTTGTFIEHDVSSLTFSLANLCKVLGDTVGKTHRYVFVIDPTHPRFPPPPLPSG